ncbi:MAG: DUF389 domain-containing protein [Candidatus Bathyarchaeota archaeon]|jgi:uncharacterized hydrophobic protein (TIGR00271 family)
MIWDVRNFYSNLERVCDEGSRFSTGYFALVVTSSLLATGGLLANSAPVIIGAMCAAPFLGPSRAVCVGWVYKKRKTAVKGLIKQLLGLLAIGSTIAFLITLAFSHLVPEIMVTPETVARTIPTSRDVCLAMFISVSSGVVASFVLVARRKMVSDSDQQRPLVNYARLLDVTIGVEIAISLIPPACVIGMGLAFGRFDIFHHSLGLLLVNVWGLNIGGMIVLYFWGIKPKPLQLEKKIRRIIKKTINDVVRTYEISSEVILHSYKKADVNVGLRAFETPHRVYESLAKTVSEEIEKETGVSNNVKIIATPVNVYTS